MKMTNAVHGSRYKVHGKRVLKLLGCFLLIPVLLFAGFVGFLTITDYRPSEKENILICPGGKNLPPDKTEFTFLTWNIGYGGLGEKMDFFYEGGTRVRPERDEFNKYLAGIEGFLSGNDSADFIFIQEADLHSRRSYYTDEVAEIGKTFLHRCSIFAKNYDSRFVPVPISDPMGRVVSGIACFPKYKPSSAERIDLGTRFYWPKQLALLKRCLMVMHYPLSSGKELVVINLHNSTFDEGGTLRKKELQKLSSILLDEYAKGNYVIAGGDWNNNPRGYLPEMIHTGDLTKSVDPALDSTFLPGWRFAFDVSVPSNRDVDMPYQKGTTKTTVIDFFVVSPNVEVMSVCCLPNGFRVSDHQPVIMKVSLK
jgi:endonuclease/exonuclease/phosphatase family metal-dependent hydrolase